MYLIPTSPSIFIFNFHTMFHVLIYPISPCSTIRAACACNRHILALESDSMLFFEVLEPLAVPPPNASTFSTAGDLNDDDEAIPDALLHDICE
jgi:hypothetical protein